MSATHDEDSLKAGPKFDPPLYLQRYANVQNILMKETPAVRKIADFGCAEGRFLRYLKKLPFAEKIACVDVDGTTLEKCHYEANPIPWDYVFGRFVALDVLLFQGSVVETDYRLKGFDAFTCIELIEHLNADVLEKFPQNVFGALKPRLVIITTPNKEYNVLFPQLSDTQFRHWDHKFEWTRDQFKSWCDSIVKDFPAYSYEIRGVGDPPEDQQQVGFCSQIAIFRRRCCEEPLNQEDNETLNYSLFNSYHYQKRRKEEEKEKVEALIDWDEVLKDCR